LHIGVVLFQGFEPLDAAGPLEIWGQLPDLHVHYIAQQAGPVKSVTAQMTWVAGYSFDQPPEHLDWLLVPGGIGTRQEVRNPALLDFIRVWSDRVQLCTSVCTGAALLAAAGVLDGKRATGNKVHIAWVMSTGPQVLWEQKARWVRDGKFVTSSGVTAGMDMAVAVLKEEYGEEEAHAAVQRCEYEPHTDPTWDPFSALVQRPR